MKFTGSIDARTDPDNAIHLRVSNQEVHLRDVVAINFDTKKALVSQRDEKGRLVVVRDADGVGHIADPLEVDATGWTVLDRRDDTTIIL